MWQTAEGELSHRAALLVRKIGGHLNGSGHLGIGMASTTLVLCGLKAVGLPIETEVIGFGAIVAGIGAIMPDIDHPSATASRALPRKLAAEAVGVGVSLVVFYLVMSSLLGKAAGAGLAAALAPLAKGVGAAALLGAGLYALSAMVRASTGHRGATHSLLFAVGATLLACTACTLLSLPAWYGVLFGWGWLTHLAADATTRAGLPSLLWPFDSCDAALAAFASPPSAVPVQRQAPLPVASSPTVQRETSAPTQAPICPTCGIPMVGRTARRGPNAGERFYGCANFPRCRCTAPLGGGPS